MNFWKKLLVFFGYRKAQVRPIETDAEALAMRGTEFIYEWPDGETIRAFVKQYDPEVGFSCYTLEAEGSDGYRPEVKEGEDYESWCLIGIDFKKTYSMMQDRGVTPRQEAFDILTEIRDTGRRVLPEEACGIGTVVCAFE